MQTIIKGCLIAVIHDIAELESLSEKVFVIVFVHYLIFNYLSLQYIQ